MPRTPDRVIGRTAALTRIGRISDSRVTPRTFTLSTRRVEKAELESFLRNDFTTDHFGHAQPESVAMLRRPAFSKRVAGGETCLVVKQTHRHDCCTMLFQGKCGHKA